MAKIIIGIHGLCNKPPKYLLEEWWHQSISEGINRHLQRDDKIPNVKIAYWADLMYDKALDPKITNKKDALFLSEPYLPRKADYKPKDNHIRKRILDFLEDKLEDFLLNEDLSSNYSYFTDKLFSNYFSDLTKYYSDEDLRNNIKERLANLLIKHKKDDIMLISHSMGTIIAYDVLINLVPKIKINSFITMGSPLGFPLIKLRLAKDLNIKKKSELKLKVPNNIINNWYNFSDISDNVSINYRLSNDYFPNNRNISITDVSVFNDYIANNERNPHKSYGYLRTEEIAKVIMTFAQTEPNSIIRLFTNVYKRFINIFNKHYK